MYTVTNGHSGGQDWYDVHVVVELSVFFPNLLCENCVKALEPSNPVGFHPDSVFLDAASDNG